MRRAPFEIGGRVEIQSTGDRGKKRPNMASPKISGDQKTIEERRVKAREIKSKNTAKTSRGVGEKNEE